MRRLFACSVACWFLAGCSESDPVETPIDAGDGSVLEAGAETSIDSTIDSGTDETALDGGDAADTLIDSALADSTPTSDAMDGEVATDSAVDVAELWVVRVGDDVAALDFAALPVSVDRVQLSTGTVVGSIALPTVASGADQPFTLPGIAGGMGHLTRSTDGRYVTMAGYAAAIGTEDVASSSTVDPPPVLRVVARIDGAGTVSTSTTTTLYDFESVHSAVTDNGNRFWLAGRGSGVTYLGGFGGSIAGTFISTGATRIRFATLIDGSLYGTKNVGTTLFNFDTALPTSASAPVTLPGSSSSTAPNGMIGFARGSSGVDLLYVCDDRSLTDGGGVQRWTKTAGTWSLATTLAPSATKGCDAIAGTFASGVATLYVTVLESPVRVVKLVDDLAVTTAPTPVTVITASAKKTIRGIALRPTP